jgi:hypothetical protein
MIVIKYGVDARIWILALGGESGGRGWMCAGNKAF